MAPSAAPPPQPSPPPRRRARTQRKPAPRLLQVGATCYTNCKPKEATDNEQCIPKAPAAKYQRQAVAAQQAAPKRTWVGCGPSKRGSKKAGAAAAAKKAAAPKKAGKAQKPPGGKASG